jgi:hypothetical protein
MFAGAKSGTGDLVGNSTPTDRSRLAARKPSPMVRSYILPLIPVFDFV